MEAESRDAPRLSVPVAHHPGRLLQAVSPLFCRRQSPHISPYLPTSPRHLPTPPVGANLAPAGGGRHPRGASGLGAAARTLAVRLTARSSAPQVTAEPHYDSHAISRRVAQTAAPSTIPPESRIQRGFSPVGGAVSGSARRARRHARAIVARAAAGEGGGPRARRRRDGGAAQHAREPAGAVAQSSSAHAFGAGDPGGAARRERLTWRATVARLLLDIWRGREMGYQVVHSFCAYRGGRDSARVRVPRVRAPREGRRQRSSRDVRAIRITGLQVYPDLAQDVQ